MSQRLPDTAADLMEHPRAGGAKPSGGVWGDDRPAASGPAVEREGDVARLGPLERLLLAPFRAAVVPTAGWSPDRPCVPVILVPPLLALARAGLGEQAAEFDAAAAEAHAPAAMQALGARLWPAAGRALAAASPTSWAAESGLDAATLDAVRVAVAQLLLCAARLETFVVQCDPARPPPEPRHVRAMLDELARVGAPGFRLGLVVLLRRCPRQENLAALALSTGRGSDDLQDAASSAATHVFDAAVTHHQNAAGAAPAEGGAIGSLPPRELAREIAEVAALARCLDAMAALRPMSRIHREVGRKRVVLQAVCLDRFETCIDVHLLRPLAAAQPQSADAMAALGRNAAELGEVATALRQLGDRHGTERAIHKATQRARSLMEASDPLATQALLAPLSGGGRC